MDVKKKKLQYIILDIQKVYHDENGNLFTQYFEKN